MARRSAKWSVWKKLAIYPGYFAIGLLVLFAWVVIDETRSEGRIINGRPDDAPRMAAMFLSGFTIIFYGVYLVCLGLVRAVVIATKAVPELRGSVMNDSGDRRLELVYISSEGNMPDIVRGADFHALVLFAKVGPDWIERVRIDRGRFQGESVTKRWVSEVHAINSEGVAVIKVAEGDAPRGSKKINYAYSWREWDLLANRELRTIRVCTDPFEKL